MAKYQHIAEQIQALIQSRGLQPGSPLPSERELAQQLGVAYGTIRSANDYLFRQGVIDRQQGRGTFVAQPASAAPPRKPARTRRLGLLTVDVYQRASPYLQGLTLALLTRVQQAGYELVIDQTGTEELAVGTLPEMITRESVDGFFLYGHVHDHHIRYLNRQPLPYMLVGNRPVSPGVPQVTINFDLLAYEVTRELYATGRTALWLDADPANTDYNIPQHMLRGYTRAVHEHDGVNAALHVCSFKPQCVAEAAAQLTQADLSRAAVITNGWSALLLLTLLRAQTPHADELLIAALPGEQIFRPLQGPHVMQWTQWVTTDHMASLAVGELVRVVEKQAARLRSFRVDMRCRLLGMTPAPHMDVAIQPQIVMPVEPHPAVPRPRPMHHAVLSERGGR